MRNGRKTMYPLCPPPNKYLYTYICIHICPNTLFSSNLTIIITGTFRITTNLLKLYINIFLTHRFIQKFKLLIIVSVTTN